MRIIAVLLSVVLIAPAALAVKPAKPGTSLEETLKYINEHLYPLQDYSNAQCSDRVQVSVSDNREDIIVKYLLIDRHDKIMESMPPRYIYRIPVTSVKTVYPWGPWTTYDRIVVRTRGRAVTKTGPVWDCDHKKLREQPKQRLLDSADLKIQDNTDWDGLIKALNHAVKLLQMQPNAKSSESQQQPDDDE